MSKLLQKLLQNQHIHMTLKISLIMEIVKVHI